MSSSPNAGPADRDDHENDDYAHHDAASGRDRRLDDLERGRQKLQLVPPPTVRSRRGNAMIPPFIALDFLLSPTSQATSAYPRLEPMELGIAAAQPHQVFVRSVFDQAAAIDRDDAVGPADRGQPVGDDEHRAPGRDAPHVLLDDPLAFVIERAGRLVEDEDARVRSARGRWRCADTDRPTATRRVRR